MFPGQADVTGDGVPVQPEFVTPGDPTSGIASLVPSVGNGDSITYSFTAVARRHVHLRERHRHRRAAADGPVRRADRPPRRSARTASTCCTAGNANTQYDPKREVVHLLSDVDPDLHIAVDDGPAARDGERFRPRYWFINGRGFPDTTAPNFADWLPNQPYGSSLHVLPIWNPAHHDGADVAGRLRHPARPPSAT